MGKPSVNFKSIDGALKNICKDPHTNTIWGVNS